MGTKRAIFMPLVLVAILLTTAATQGCSVDVPDNTWVELVVSGGYGPQQQGWGPADLVYDSESGKMIFFGKSGLIEPDVWTYDPAVNEWRHRPEKKSAYVPREAAGLAYDSRADKVILFGGSIFGRFFDETWAYDPSDRLWTNLEPRGEVPPARSPCAMVYDERLDRVLLFGGCTDSFGAGQTFGLLGDTWSYDLTTNTWTDLEPSGPTPAPRTGHAMVYDPDAGRVLLFGGESLEALGPSQDLWSYDPVANEWTQLDPAGEAPVVARTYATVWDPHAHRVLLVGGTGGYGLMGIGHATQLWAYDPAANAWEELHPLGQSPSPRDLPAVAYDPITNRIIVVGGLGESGWFFDTWGYVPAQ